jgi:hypothetical protein
MRSLLLCLLCALSNVSGFVRIPVHRRPHLLAKPSLVKAPEVVDVVVGGINYPFIAADLRKYQNGELGKVLDASPQTHSKFDRDGKIFRYIYSYIVSGHLPRERDVQLLNLIRGEAIFYGVTGLVLECDRVLGLGKKIDAKALYGTISDLFHCYSNEADMSVDYKEETALECKIDTLYAPYYRSGNITDKVKMTSLPLLDNSTVHKLNLTELIAKAVPSPFGQGSKTVYDSNVRDSLEIPASELNQETLTSLAGRMNIADLAPSMALELRPYKLVIYQEGGHFDEHRDTVRGEGHIGTLVLTLNSEYTGGELEITHGGRTNVVTGPYSWVAMYGDCLHKVNHVTSGTRVSLIYDIYAEPSDDSTSDIDYRYYRVSDSDFFAHPPNAVKQGVNAALDEELNHYDELVICLQHLYPVSQAVPGFLKGVDRVLYDALQDNYAVQVVHAHVDREFNNWGDPECVTADVYGATPPERGTVERGTAGSRKKIKFLLPQGLDLLHELEYTPSIERTGNEAHEGHQTYLVAALRVRKKKL